MEKNKKLLKEKELLEEKAESVNQIKQESSDILVLHSDDGISFG